MFPALISENRCGVRKVPGANFPAEGFIGFLEFCSIGADQGNQFFLGAAALAFLGLRSTPMGSPSYSPSLRIEPHRSVSHAAVETP